MRPRRHRFSRAQRLASAKSGLQKGQRHTIRTYRRWYRIDRLCAAVELHALGCLTDDELARERALAAQAATKPKRRGRKAGDAVAAELEGIWVEGGEASELGLAYTAGFTPGGAPFGITDEELAESDKLPRASNRAGVKDKKGPR